MLINYLKVSLRNLLKYKQSSLLNILGLAFGLACCAVCYLHIQFELGYDRFNTNYKSIYRLVAGDPSTEDFWVKVAAPMPPLFKSQIPGIDDYVRFTNVSYNPNVLVTHEDDSFLEKNFLMADPSLFNIFTFPAINGDPVKALSDLNSVVITESTARKVFGSTDVLGKIITLKDEQLDFQVGAVVKDVPEQSHFTFNYLISFENLDRVLGDGYSTSWGMYNYFAYLLVNDQTNQTTLSQKIQEAKHNLPDSKEVTFERIHLQPLSDIHFKYNRGNQTPSYDKKYIYVFTTIALSLLAIACINYINLSIALSIKRIKEIGVRKAVGANRSQLILQFTNEGLLAAFMALAAGLLLLEAFLPFVNSLFGSSIHTNYSDSNFLLFIIGSMVTVGLISGSYLAFYVNGYRTSSILKGSLRSENKGLSLQQGLVFVQFSISIILIVCSLIISSQMNFLQNKNLGFDHDQILTVPLSSTISTEQTKELKKQLLQSSDVQSVASSSFTPGTTNWNQTVWWEGQSEPMSMFIISVDEDFLQTMNINLSEGDVKQIVSSTEDVYLLNQAARDYIGWDVAVGKPFSPYGGNRKQAVGGVVDNFNFMSLHHEVSPLVLIITDQSKMNQLAIKVAGGDLQQSIASVKSAYERVLGDIPFEYSFMDDNINRLYESEARVRSIVSTLSVIAIFFALFGVYGLISFSIENKTKEIAIRKVLGVAAKDLLILFSKSYYRLMAIAFVIAIPIVWNVMSDWLNNFSYRTDINLWWFVIAFVGVMIAISGIGFSKYFSLRQINPAQALKNE